jgi:dipeptide/tripeptide permease
MRRVIELNSRMAILAFVSLALAATLATFSTVAGTFSDHVGAVTFLVAFGWLTGLGLAKIYKIVAFLTWLECYGPVLGKTATPRVQDLVDERRATPWFAAYFTSTWIATVALLATAPTAFRFAAAVMAIATGGIVVHLVRTRRLCDVAASLRLPSGARRPRLFLSIPQ